MSFHIPRSPHHLLPYNPASRPPLPRRSSRSPDKRVHADNYLVDDPPSRSPPTQISIPVPPLPAPFTSTPAFWLILYFIFNLSLTLYNKSVLVRFPFPYTLTALHALCSAVGSYSLRTRGLFTPVKTSPQQNALLLAFSFLYTVNIAVSNLSLEMVTIPFHQVIRSTTPLFTLLLSLILLRSKFSLQKLISLIPVVLGIPFATYGDYYFTFAGLLLTLLGTLLASLKTISTNLLQASSSDHKSHSPHHHHNRLFASYRLTTKLHPLDLLLRMSPLAFIQCVLYAHLSGELDRVRAFSATHMTTSRLIALLINGIIAFGLNVVSFTANRKSGPLTMTVAANVKQVLTILLAVLIFNLSLTPTNAVGIILTLVGGGWYGLIEYREKEVRRRGSGVGFDARSPVCMRGDEKDVLDDDDAGSPVLSSTTTGTGENWVKKWGADGLGLGLGIEEKVVKFGNVDWFGGREEKVFLGGLGR